MRLVDNIETVKKIKKKIKDNNGYCPCAFIKTADYICPCRDMREKDECRCGLYVKDIL